MNGFLLALIVCFASEISGRGQYFIRFLTDTQRRSIVSFLTIAVGLALGVGVILAAAGPIAATMSADARLLFMAVTMLFHVMHLIGPQTCSDLNKHNKLRSWPLVLAHFIALLPGSSTLFCMLGIAVGLGEEWLVCTGGGVGMLAAYILARHDLMLSDSAGRIVRRTFGVIVALAGIIWVGPILLQA